MGFLHYICNAIFYKMQERFKQLLEEKNLTATRFAALIKVNASAMSHILNGRSKPGFDVLDKIAQAFPDLNLNWLISGKGSMYNSSISIAEPAGRKVREEKPVIQEPQVVAQPEKEVQPSLPGSVLPLAQSTHKKIKRIILFFEDGSFEDYEK